MTLEAFPKKPQYNDLYRHLREETGLKKEEELPALVSIIKIKPNMHEIVIDDNTQVRWIGECVNGGSSGGFMQGGKVEVSAFDKSGSKRSLNLKKQDRKCIFFHETDLRKMIEDFFQGQNGEIKMEIWGYHKKPNASKTCFVFTTNLRDKRA